MFMSVHTYAIRMLRFTIFLNKFVDFSSLFNTMDYSVSVLDCKTTKGEKFKVANTYALHCNQL